MQDVYVDPQLPTHSDINSLNRTCKSLHAATLPILYGHLVLQIPTSKSGLATVEQLVASFPTGLRYTYRIDVVAARCHDGGNLFDNASEDLTVGTLTERCEVNPSQSAIADTFNTLLRLLILKVPRNSLRQFSYVIP